MAKFYDGLPGSRVPDFSDPNLPTLYEKEPDVADSGRVIGDGPYATPADSKLANIEGDGPMAKKANGLGKDPKYGSVWAENKAFHQDEPVLVLRASDRLAPAAIRAYAELCEAAGVPNDHTCVTLETAQVFLDWQQKNAKLVKKPGTKIV